MQKQQAEESKEIQFLAAKQHEVVALEQQIRQKAEYQKKAGVELEATCQVGHCQLDCAALCVKVCLKTKFADGVGHLCNYCSVRCCARCGGKVTLRSNKVSSSPAVPCCTGCPGYLGLHTLPEEAGAADQVRKVDAGRQRLLAGGPHYAANRAGHGPHPRHPGLLLHRALGLHLISVLKGGTQSFEFESLTVD